MTSEFSDERKCSLISSISCVTSFILLFITLVNISYIFLSNFSFALLLSVINKGESFKPVPMFFFLPLTESNSRPVVSSDSLLVNGSLPRGFERIVSLMPPLSALFS